MSPSARATSVLPTPGFPVKTICRLSGAVGRPCARRFCSTCSRAIRPLTSRLTGTSPTMASRSSIALLGGWSGISRSGANSILTMPETPPPEAGCSAPLRAKLAASTVTRRPRLASMATITIPLSADCVEGASPLIHPAGPDCGLKIQAVMMETAKPPIIIGRICWSLKKFFISTVVRLAGPHGMPPHGNVLWAGKFYQRLGRVETEDGAGGIAFDDKGAGARAVGRRVGYRDSLDALGYREIGRDVAARPDSNCAAEGGVSLGERERDQRYFAAFCVLDQPSGRRRRQGNGGGPDVALSHK